VLDEHLAVAFLFKQDLSVVLLLGALIYLLLLQFFLVLLGLKSYKLCPVIFSLLLAHFILK
jgi:hypothetical protein